MVRTGKVETDLDKAIDRIQRLRATIKRIINSDEIKLPRELREELFSALYYTSEYEGDKNER